MANFGWLFYGCFMLLHCRLLRFLRVCDFACVEFVDRIRSAVLWVVSGLRFCVWGNCGSRAEVLIKLELWTEHPACARWPEASISSPASCVVVTWVLQVVWEPPWSR